VDRKLEPVIKRKMTEYLGELEDDDLVMFVVEHLKDKKGPHKLVEGLEPVRPLLMSVFYSIFCSPAYYPGPCRRSRRICDCTVASDHIRKYGLRRGIG
jgi:hypothetical protein